ncbi:MAG: heparinase II/III-family protein [Coriobacteriia bacterium]|nr:heparinase II/III-family protein [Coriobacteriia bacterium]
MAVAKKNISVARSVPALFSRVLRRGSSRAVVPPHRGNSSYLELYAKTYDPHYPYESDKVVLKLADLLLSGKLAVNSAHGYPEKFDVENIDWNVQVAPSPRSYQLSLQGLNAPAILCRAFELTESKEYLDLSEQLIRSYLAYELSEKAKENEMVWHDHVAAIRAENLIYCELVLDKWGGLDKDTKLLFEDILERSAEFLSDDKYYTKNHNHGVYQDRALLNIAFYLQNGKSDAWIEHAKLRLEKQFEHAYTTEMVHVENSYSYHLNITKLFQKTCRLLETHDDFSLGYFSEKLENSRDFMAWLLKPNGEYVQTGDSNKGDVNNFPKKYRKNKDLLACLLNDKKESWNTPSYKEYPEAGYFVYREFWNSDERPRQDSIWCLFRAGCISRVHKHKDDLSFVLYGKGHDIFIDPGYYAYQKNDPLVAYLRSAKAHNTILVDNNSYDLTSYDMNKVGLFEVPQSTSYYCTGGFNDVYDGVSIERYFYVLGDAFVIYDNMLSQEKHVYSQLFQCAPDMNVVKKSDNEVLMRLGDTDYYLRITQMLKNTSAAVISGSDKNAEYGYVSYYQDKYETTNTIKFDIEGRAGQHVEAITLIKIEDEFGSVKNLENFALNSQTNEFSYQLNEQTITIPLVPSKRSRAMQAATFTVSESHEGNNYRFINETTADVPLQYAWFVYDLDAAKYLLKRPYSDEQTLECELFQGGNYKIVSKIKDQAGANRTKEMFVSA